MLTDIKCRAAKPQEKVYRLPDSHGLCLEVRPTGTKLWRYRYRLAEKQNMFALGEYPTMSLQDARRARDEARDQVKQGINPSHHRELEKAARVAELDATFKSVSQKWIERNRNDWAERYAKQVQTRLEKDVWPEIGQYPITDLKAAHVLAMLRKVEARSVTQAKLVQIWVGGVFRYAVIEQLREDDPTYALRGALKTARPTHYAILAEREIGPFLRGIDTAVGAKSAVALLWATVCRINEVVGARWDEFDMEHGLWTIPAERMKGRHEHVVPLTRQALDILRPLHAHRGNHEFVFPHRSDRKRSMSEDAIRDVFARAGYEGRLTPHGVRGTFSTVANEAGWRSDVIELCLAHREPNTVRRAYNHAQLLEERRELLQWWCDMSDQAKVGGKVVAFKRVAA